MRQGKLLDVWVPALVCSLPGYCKQIVEVSYCQWWGVMNKTLARKIIERLSLSVAVILAIVYLGLKPFGVLNDPNYGMNILLGMVALLGVDRILASWQRSDDEKAMEDIRQSLSRLVDAIRPINAYVSKPPASIEDYKDIYSNFTGIFLAYNPSYSEEGKPGLKNNRLIEEIFVPFFANDQFEKAHYLFFTEDVDGQRSLTVFKDLMKKVTDLMKKVKPEVELHKKLEVRQIKHKQSSNDAELYLGTKKGNPYAVIKTKDDVLNDKGDPRFYLVAKDETLNRELQDQFNSLWTKFAEEVKDFLN